MTLERLKPFFDKASSLDKNDKLSRFKDAFEPSKEHLIYMDGNSLGKLPIRTKKALNAAIENQWGQRLIRSWNEHWIELWKDCARAIAPLVGAREDEIYVGDSTSVNLYKLAFAALAKQKGKHQLLTDALNFPSDLYIFNGLKASFPNLKVDQIPSKDSISTDLKDIEEHLSENTALLSLSLVTYQSAYLYDMAAVNKLAQKVGALTLWDLSHANGAVEIDLNASGADMAVGCTYKYLNAGPGAPAFLYVRKELQQSLETPIQGWFAHKNPFDFSTEYEKSDTIYQFAAGTPTVLSMIGVKEGASLMQQAGMANVRAKSQQMSQLFQEAYESILKPLGYAWGSPQELSQRGSHVSLQHEEAWRINQSLIHPIDNSLRLIIPDFRPPKSLRIGFTPLYTSFTEVVEVIERLVNIIENEEYKQHSTDRSLVP